MIKVSRTLNPVPSDPIRDDWPKKQPIHRPGSETPAEKEARERSYFRAAAFYWRLLMAKRAEARR